MVVQILIRFQAILEEEYEEAKESKIKREESYALKRCVSRLLPASETRGLLLEFISNLLIMANFTCTCTLSSLSWALQPSTDAIIQRHSKLDRQSFSKPTGDPSVPEFWQDVQCIGKAMKAKRSKQAVSILVQDAVSTMNMTDPRAPTPEPLYPAGLSLRESTMRIRCGFISVLCDPYGMNLCHPWYAVDDEQPLGSGIDKSRLPFVEDRSVGESDDEDEISFAEPQHETGTPAQGSRDLMAASSLEETPSPLDEESPAPNGAEGTHKKRSGGALTQTPAAKKARPSRAKALAALRSASSSLAPEFDPSKSGAATRRRTSKAQMATLVGE